MLWIPGVNIFFNVFFNLTHLFQPFKLISCVSKSNFWLLQNLSCFMVALPPSI